MKKELILDYSIWRCGRGGHDEVGHGLTQLCNSYGYQCCLGQFSTQLNPDLTTKEITNQCVPKELGVRVPLLTKRVGKNWEDTVLSEQAIEINDDKLTSPNQKIVKLKKLFKKQGYTINVINQPK